MNSGKKTLRNRAKFPKNSDAGMCLRESFPKTNKKNCDLGEISTVVYIVWWYNEIDKFEFVEEKTI